MTKDERQKHLNRAHSTYYAFNQQPSEGVLLMAELGHPFAEDYQTLFAAWDDLRYASNSDERYVAFKDEHDHVTWNMPRLEVETYPRDYSRHVAVFGNDTARYPADREGYLNYIRANARLGWPPEGGARLDPGTIAIETTHYRLVADVFTIMKGLAKIEIRDGGAGHRVRLRHPGPDAGQALKILAAVKRRMSRWMCPPRTEADRVFDAVPLPLEQRPLTFGNVKGLTLTDHAVMIPLIPISTAGNLLATAVANDLVNLCRSHSYPYEGPVRDWLEKFVAKGDLKKLDREFRDAK